MALSTTARGGRGGGLTTATRTARRCSSSLTTARRTPLRGRSPIEGVVRVGRAANAYKSMYTHIYIYPPAPFRGPSGCEAFLCIPFPVSCILVSCCSVSCFLFPSSPSVCYCQFISLVFVLGLLKSAIGDIGFLFSGPTDRGLTSSLGPSRVSLENHRISYLLPRPSKIRKSEFQVPRKLSKRHPKVD